MSFFKKGKSLVLIASLAVVGVVGIGAKDSYALGEEPFSKTVSGYKVSGTTSLSRTLKNGHFLYTAKGSSTENYVTGNITVQTYIYYADTGKNRLYSKHVTDTIPRDGKVSTSVNLDTTDSYDFGAKSYHTGVSGSTSIVGYSYDRMPN